MFSRGNRRSGFTLPEVLVTVAIVAVLAAIVVPTVTNQIGKGDDTNVVANVQTLKTGITAYVSDVRKFPRRLQHLIFAVDDTTDDITGADIGAGAAARWRGPYMPFSLKAQDDLATDSVAWGGLAFALDSLSDTSFTGSAVDGYIGLTLGGVANSTVALQIDALIDGGTGQTAGNLRWLGTAPAVTDNRLTYLLMGK